MSCATSGFGSAFQAWPFAEQQGWCCLLPQDRAQDKNEASGPFSSAGKAPVPPLAGGSGQPSPHTQPACDVSPGTAASNSSCQTGPSLSCLLHPLGHLLCLFCDNVTFVAPRRPPGLDAQTIPLTMISVFLIIIFSLFFFFSFILHPPRVSGEGVG